MWYPMFHGEVRLRNLAVAQNQDGRLEVFGTAPDDRIWHAWQSVAGKGWELWHDLFSPAGLRTVIAAQNSDGRLEIFGTAPDETIWHTWQTAPGAGWHSWQAMLGSTGRLRDLAVAQNQDGRLEVFGTASDDTVWQAWQTSPGGAWAGWRTMFSSSDRLKNLSVERNEDGRLEVFGTAPDDSIWQAWQTAPGGAWHPWRMMFTPSDKLRNISVARNLDGRLEVFGTAPDDSIWQAWQISPGGAWDGWHPMFSSTDKLKNVSVGSNQDGRLELFGTAPDDTIWHTWQTAPGAGWETWHQMFDSADRLRALAVARNLDGRLEVFGTATDNSVWHNWQRSPSSSWRGDRAPGSDTPWAVLLCKFNDNAAEPFPRAFYEREFTAAGAGDRNMVDFFEDVSHDHVDLRASRVFGWFTLNHPRRDYTGSGLNPAGRDQLVTWAKDAATAAGVNLRAYSGVVVCMNVNTDLFGGGGRVVCDPDSMCASTLSQEMGHGYGLTHSRADGTLANYTDRWDVMSTLNAFMTPHHEFFAVGPALNAWNLRSRGWLDESRVWKESTAGFDQTIQLRSLGHRDLPGLLAAELPGGFLAELRTKNEWDAAIPEPAILVHRFEAGNSYLMKSASGREDIVKADFFQSNVGRSSPPTPVRLDVVDIDSATDMATVRLRFGWCAADDGALPMSPDIVTFHVDHQPGGVAVEWVLDTGGYQLWKKQIVLDDGLGGRWTIETDGAKMQDHNGLYLYQLPQGRAELWKAGVLGFMHKIVDLPIACFQGGDRITVTWLKD